MHPGSTTDRSNGIRLRNSFYNDENLDYLTKSNVMLKTSRSYQARNISQSTRKRIDTEKCEEVMRKKRDSSFYSIKSEGALSLHRTPKQTPKKSLATLNKLPTKFNSTTKINKQILQNYIDSKL